MLASLGKCLIGPFVRLKGTGRLEYCQKIRRPDVSPGLRHLRGGIFLHGGIKRIASTREKTEKQPASGLVGKSAREYIKGEFERCDPERPHYPVEIIKIHFSTLSTINSFCFTET